MHTPLRNSTSSHGHSSGAGGGSDGQPISGPPWCTYLYATDTHSVPYVYVSTHSPGYALSSCVLGANPDRSTVSVCGPTVTALMQAMPDGLTLRSGRMTGIGDGTVSHGSTGLGLPSGPSLHNVPNLVASTTPLQTALQNVMAPTATSAGGSWAPSGASAGLPTPLASSFSSPLPTGVHT